MSDETATSSLAAKYRHRPIVRWTLVSAGTVLVGIGILGIFLPLLPTTVFFLMAAWCYAHSSPSLYHWLHHNRLFGKYIKDYREGRGITVRSKVMSIVVLWVGILYSAWSVEGLALRLVLGAVAVGVTVHLVVIPTNRSTQ